MLGGQEVVIRLVVRALPGPDVPEAARELRRRLHAALAEAGIRMGTVRDIGIAGAAARHDALRGAKPS